MKTGFIGMGNMGSALAEAAIKTGAVLKGDTYGYAPHQDKLKERAERIGFIPCSDPIEMVKECDNVMISCKPAQIPGVLNDEMKKALKGKHLISIAAGWFFDDYRKILGDDTRIQCINPNMAVKARSGIILIEEKGSFTEHEYEVLLRVLNSFSRTVVLPAELMDAGCAIAGCGPAYAAMFIEALADAGLKYGLKRDDAYTLAAAMLKGTGALCLDEGMLPAVLKDAVCSPGGTTIRGLSALEKTGFRGSVISAIDAVVKGEG